ncbi:NAD-dependent epimerase/dehydratase family protein [Sphingomonas radiodurans]|uniref:NAD-dependent epimerase/dehydratase family protein n=1 Tax=Sphingomonas radiodurans TaxID=2890321 RepID=UPI001E415783|nr:NAD-dependent epimerase/dehydratase family protein [Sphingomonas radiodurans]WBH17678.1 NAD-dependent epimerase/dehydratase family protein [Sphingomonas radiodurans]
MAYLVTGAAGFIGAAVAQRLLDRGEQVIGIDNLSDYYPVHLKRDRLATLAHPNFTFAEVDIADAAALKAALAPQPITHIIHLAAQAGVRYSITNPEAYVQSNLVGHVNMLEYARRCDGLVSMSYASSSSVYGGNTKLPFAEDDRVDAPISLYAATKKADELMGNVYAHLFRLPLTGLRFFTVYGPWGRPDMALWLFTDAILQGKPIRVFNHGDMSRDFTFIDDIVAGVVAVTDSPPADDGKAPPHCVYNIGNNKPEQLLRMIDVLEDAIGIKAIRSLEPMQPGDVPATYADITAIARDHGFAPTTPIEVGIPRFVEWFKSYTGFE